MSETRSIRGEVAGRPPTPWGASDKPPSQNEVVARVAGSVLAVLNPLVTLLAYALTASGRSFPRRVRWQIAAASGAVMLVAAFFGALRAYLRPYKEIVATLLSDGAGGASVAHLAGQEWPGWLAAQLPLGIPAAGCAGGLWLMWRSRFAAEWRETPSRASDKKLGKQLTELETPRPPASRVDELEVRLGADVYTAKPCTVPGKALRLHTFISGATGYGKTNTVESLVHQLVVDEHARGLNIPVLFADMKADPDLISAMRGAAHAAGRRFRLITVTGKGGSYNPIRHGTAEQVRSRIVECLDQVAGGGFSEPHHREAAEEFLLYVVRALDDLVGQRVVERFPDDRRAWRRDLPDLARLMSIKELQDRLQQLSGPVSRDILRYMEYLAAEAKSLLNSFPGLAARVRNLVSGDAGRVLSDVGDGVLDLHASIQAGDIVLLSLDVAQDARAARQVGNLFLTDLMSVGGRLLHEGYGAAGGFFLAGVDEFSGLGGTTMSGLFQRVRAAGGGLLLSTQDVADLSEFGEGFASAVLTNTNVVILHRQKSSAEKVSEMLGTREAWQETVQLQEDTGVLGVEAAGTGLGSLKSVDKFKVHPNELRELEQGEAVLVVGHPVDAMHTMRVRKAPRLSAPSDADDTKVSLAKPEPPDDELPDEPAGMPVLGREQEHQDVEADQDEREKKAPAEERAHVPGEELWG